MKFSEIINDQQLATEALRRWSTIAACVAIAILTAYWIASAKFFLLTLLTGMVVVAFVTVGLQRNAWILIVIGWSFLGAINALPLPLQTRDIIVLVVTFAYAAQRVVGQITSRSKGVLGAIVGINCFYLAICFVLHPAGVHALGAETIGGRPYFAAFIAMCAYWVLVHMPDSYKGVSRIPVWLMAGMTFSSAVSALVYISPSITPYVWYFGGGADTTGYIYDVLNPAVAAPEVHRLNSLAPFGAMLIQFMGAYFSPSKFLNPARWQFYLIALGFVMILASGFRTHLGLALVSIMLAAWFHRGWREVILGGLLGAVFLGFLCYGQGRFFDLPLPAQRALGSLPGQWSEVVKADVKNSNERYLWWWQLIQEGRLAKNVWLGDGFGMSEAEFDVLGQGRANFYEAAELTGAFHSGPLTTIRAVGLVGLILFYALMIASAVYAVRLVNRCRGTPLFPAAVFLALDVCWRPVHFTFVFGGYNVALPEQLFVAGLLTVIWYMSERQPPPTAPTARARPLSPTNRAPLFSP
jgi:hypothetical protein